MSENKRTNGSINGRGYYIALVLCAAAIGITGYLYYRNANQTTATLLETDGPDIIVGTLETEADVPAVATEPQVEAAVPTVPEPQRVGIQTLQTAPPVSGDLLASVSWVCALCPVGCPGCRECKHRRKEPPRNMEHFHVTV